MPVLSGARAFGLLGQLDHGGACFTWNAEPAMSGARAFGLPGQLDHGAACFTWNVEPAMSGARAFGLPASSIATRHPFHVERTDAGMGIERLGASGDGSPGDPPAHAPTDPGSRRPAMPPRSGEARGGDLAQRRAAETAKRLRRASLARDDPSREHEGRQTNARLRRDVLGPRTVVMPAAIGIDPATG